MSSIGGFLGIAAHTATAQEFIEHTRLGEIACLAPGALRMIERSGGDAPIVRSTALDVRIPIADGLEGAVRSSPQRIAAVVERLLYIAGGNRHA